MTLLDIFFPKRCVGCGKIGQYFCISCRAKIKPIAANEAICPVCEKLAVDGITHPRCKTRYSLDGLTSFFHYDGSVRKAVKSIKYRFVYDLAEEFISLVPSKIYLPSTFNSLQSILVPIPLHPSRLRERGFNQAEKLGSLWAAQLHIPVRTDILKRVKKTEPQVSLKREERLKNMENVFAINPSTIYSDRIGVYPLPSTIFLFDDVFTTGATMRSAANVLKRNGAKFVWAVTMAR